MPDVNFDDILDV